MKIARAIVILVLVLWAVGVQAAERKCSRFVGQILQEIDAECAIINDFKSQVARRYPDKIFLADPALQQDPMLQLLYNPLSCFRGNMSGTLGGEPVTGSVYSGLTVLSPFRFIASHVT